MEELAKAEHGVGEQDELEEQLELEVVRELGAGTGRGAGRRSSTGGGVPCWPSSTAGAGAVAQALHVLGPEGLEDEILGAGR